LKPANPVRGFAPPKNFPRRPRGHEVVIEQSLTPGNYKGLLHYTSSCWRRCRKQRMLCAVGV